MWRLIRCGYPLVGVSAKRFVADRFALIVDAAVTCICTPTIAARRAWCASWHWGRVLG
ncbi:MAG: hypothetical protein ABIQ36_00235 [Rhodanobacter sp.]